MLFRSLMSSFDHGLLAGAFFARAAAFAMFGSPQWIQRIYRDSRVLHPPQHSQSRVTLQRLRITSQTNSVNRMPRTERTGFSFERKHGCRRQARRKSANDPTAPSALADPGLVLVRGPGSPGPPG